MDTFLKRAYLRSFLGLTSLHSVNIQPNSKLHPFHQNFLDPPLDVMTFFFALHLILRGKLDIFGRDHLYFLFFGFYQYFSILNGGARIGW